MRCLDVDLSGYAGPLKRPMLSCILQDFYLIQDFDEDFVIAGVDRFLQRLGTSETVAAITLNCSRKRTVLQVRRLDGVEETMTLNGLGCTLKAPTASR